MNTLKTTLATAAIALGTLAATACGASGSESGATAGPAAAAPAGASSARTSQAVRAIRTADRQVSRGRPYDLETERYRGRRVWEVKVAAGKRRPYRFYVSADGRTIVRRSRARRDDDARRARKAKTSLGRALRTADRRAAGRLDEAEIDRTRAGTIVWSVTFERSRDRDTEVTINARTGNVIRVETDD